MDHKTISDLSAINSEDLKGSCNFVLDDQNGKTRKVSFSNLKSAIISDISGSGNNGCSEKLNGISSDILSLSSQISNLQNILENNNDINNGQLFPDTSKDSSDFFEGKFTSDLSAKKITTLGTNKYLFIPSNDSIIKIYNSDNAGNYPLNVFSLNDVNFLKPITRIGKYTTEQFYVPANNILPIEHVGGSSTTQSIISYYPVTNNIDLINSNTTSYPFYTLVNGYPDGNIQKLSDYIENFQIEIGTSGGTVDGTGNITGFQTLKLTSNIMSVRAMRFRFTAKKDFYITTSSNLKEYYYSTMTAQNAGVKSYRKKTHRVSYNKTGEITDFPTKTTQGLYKCNTGDTVYGGISIGYEGYIGRDSRSYYYWTWNESNINEYLATITLRILEIN